MAILNTALAITKMEKNYFSELSAHSIRCAKLIRQLALETGYDDNITHLVSGALIHDIGKLYIPIEILGAPRKLTDREFSFIQKHVSYGERLARSYEIFTKTEIDMILYHHEKLDGSGYLHKTSDELSREVQMMTVVDIFESLTANRCYHIARTSEEAFDNLYQLAKQGKINMYYVKALEKVINKPQKRKKAA